MSDAAADVQLFIGEHEIERADRVLQQGEVCVRSIRSPEKSTNEDSAAVIPLGDGSLVLAVADGVGGMPGGREASNVVVQTLARMLRELPASTEQLRPTILDAVEEANRAVLGLGRGAATTLVVAQLDAAGRLRSYHVGDSELLAVGQRGLIKQRVVPHSPTGFAVEAGLLDADEAVQHDQRHVLFNVIGSDEMRVEIGPVLELAVRDTVLLASDGLFDNLFIDEIVDTIRRGPLVAAADALVERASARMQGQGAADLPCKPDDLTIILFRRPK